VTIKIVHIGLGIRGSHWLQFVAEHPDTESVACVDADAAALERAKAKVPGKCGFFSGVAEAIATSGANAALITSPSQLHAEHAIAALRAGLAVMVEKPFAASIQQARAILEVAQQTGKQVLVAENYRYWPSERTIRAWVKDGRLGKIDNVTLVDRRNMPARTEGPWLAKIDYPQLGEIAIHHFDSLRGMLLSEATALSAHVWNPPGSDYRHGACSAATVEMGGTRVQYLGTMTSPRYSFSLRLEGSEGEMWTNRKYVFWRAKGKRFFKYVKNVPVPAGDEQKYPKGGTTSLLDALREAVLRNAVAETSGADNLGTLAMVEAAKRSDAQRRQVALAEIVAA
jgi:predicted dehydrogenase